MSLCVNLLGLPSPSSLSYPSLDPRTAISIITPTADVSASIGINRRYLIVVTLSRSEGSLSIGREMLSPVVTLSRSEGSLSIGREMLRGVYPERSEWAQYDMKRHNQKSKP